MHTPEADAVFADDASAEGGSGDSGSPTLVDAASSDGERAARKGAARRPMAKKVVELEKEREKLPLPAPTSSSVIATEGNTRGGGVVEKIEKKEDPGFVTLDLSLDDLAADAKSSSPRRASRSPPRKKTRS